MLSLLLHSLVAELLSLPNINYKLKIENFAAIEALLWKSKNNWTKQWDDYHDAKIFLSVLSVICSHTAWKMSNFGVFLVRIFPHSDWDNFSSACNFIEKETLAQLLSCKFWEIFRNTFYYRTPLVAASLVCSFTIYFFRTNIID